MKNKLWVRLLLALLMLTMVLTAVACDKDEKEPENTEEKETGEEEVTYPFEIEDLGEDNGAPGRFNMITRTERCDYIYSEQDGSILHDAVFERNALTEELFNVEITMFEGGHSEAKEYVGNVTTDVMSGDGQYDCVLAWDGSGLEMRGWYMNLLSFDELNFDEDPWWFKEWNENGTINDCLITCNGDLQFEIYYDIMVVFYNKTLAAAIEMNPYPYVDNKTWTLEQLEIFSEQIKKEDSVNGGWIGEDGATDENKENFYGSDAVYGSLYNQSAGTPIMFALGAKYSTVHDDGTIEWTIAKESNYNIFDALYTAIRETEWNVVYQTTTLGEGSYKLFNEDRALFCWNAVRVGEFIKPSGVQYGLLPIPMYNEQQGEYITTCYAHSYFAFLTTTPDFHRSAMVFNAMNALSTTILYDTYFGEILAFRYADDPESSRMVPLIRDSLYFDYTWTNNSLCDSVAHKFGGQLMTGSKNIASAVSGAERTLNFLMTTYQKVYENVKLSNSR